MAITTFGFIDAFTGAHEVSLSSFLDAVGFDATVNWRIKPQHVVVEVLDDLGQGHESVWIISLIFRARHSDLKVGCNQCERIPALIAPRICDGWRPLQDDVFAAFLFEVVA